jgi:hypothetical protein
MSVANHISEAPRKTSPDSTEKQSLLIATPFGELTREEIREWEIMLGRPLLRLPQTPEN